MDNKEKAPDLGKVLQAGRLAKISLYRRLLKNVAEGARLPASELRMLRELGAELEELARREEEQADSSRVGFERVSRAKLARHVFNVSAQTISRWVTREGMPRNEDGSFCVADCVEWALERVEGATAPGKKGEENESEKWLTAFRRERALKARMERQELEGRLFPREEVTAAWCNRYAHLKRHLMVWSKRLPGRLTGLDEREMIGLLDDEVHFLLSMLARPGAFTELAEDVEADAATQSEEKEEEG